MKKKILSMVLCLFLMVGMMPTWAMPTAAAGSGVSQKLDALRNTYPHGQYWYRVNGINQVSSSPCPHYYDLSACGFYNRGWQCWAFASKVFHDVFGQDPNVFGDQRRDKAGIRVGDYVRFSFPGNPSYGHSFVVTARDGDWVTVVENNYGGNCRINWDNRYNLNNALYISGVGYAYFDYYCRATNYDEVNKPAGTTSKPSVSVNTQNITVSWSYSGGGSSIAVYLIQSPWGWDDIKYTQEVSPDSTSCTFTNVAPGSYCAFTIAQPNDAWVQSEWTEFTVQPPLNIGEGFYARIKYPDGDKYLENRDGNVQIANGDDTDPRQIWYFYRKGNAYIIRNLYDGRNLDSPVSGGSGTNVGVWEDNSDSDGSGEKWYVYCDAGRQQDGVDEFYNIVSAYNNSLGVDVYNADTSVGTNVQVWTINSTAAQSFQIQQINKEDINSTISTRVRADFGDDFTAQISYLGSYLEAAGDASNGLMNVQTNNVSRPTDPKQIWRFIKQEDGYYTGSYKIVNEYNGWCLSVDNNTVKDGQSVNLSSQDNAMLSQRWYLVNSPGDTTYRFISAMTFPWGDGTIYSLDIPVGAPGQEAPNGTNPTIFHSHQNSNQQFTVTKVTCPEPTPTPGVTLSGKVKYYGEGTATVTLINADTQEALDPVETVADGAYTVTGIVPGKYHIQIDRPRYTTVTKENVPVDGNTQIDDIDITSGAGDIDGDNVISIEDLTLLLRNFGNASDSITNQGADINSDGVVTLEDLTILLRNFGNGSSSGIIID